jgi:hypothetical protein
MRRMLKKRIGAGEEKGSQEGIDVREEKASRKLRNLRQVSNHLAEIHHRNLRGHFDRLC